MVYLSFIVLNIGAEITALAAISARLNLCR